MNVYVLCIMCGRSVGDISVYIHNIFCDADLHRGAMPDVCCRSEVSTKYINELKMRIVIGSGTVYTSRSTTRRGRA